MKHWMIIINADVGLLNDLVANKEIAISCQNSNKVKQGDSILGYVASPINQVKSVFTATKDGNDKFVYVKKLFEVSNGTKVDDNTIVVIENAIKDTDDLICIDEKKYNQLINDLYMSIDNSIVKNDGITSTSDEMQIFNHNLFGMHITKKNNALSNENPHICIGWSKLGDLTPIIQKEAIYEMLQLHDPGLSSYTVGRHANQIWRFKNEAQIGDYVILAEPNVIHIGRITSEYYYDSSETPDQFDDYKNTRKVEWLKKNINRSILSRAMHSSLSARSPFFNMNDYKSAVADLLQDRYLKDEDESGNSLVYETGIKKDEARNRIYFGAPGTGKSYNLNENVKKLLKDNDNSEPIGGYIRVTFHQDYSYAQFVGTYKPTMNGNQIEYKYVPGPFMRILAKAYKNIIENTDETGSVYLDGIEPFVLVIEEINRAKAAAVFGDMFQLLDRDDNGSSEYDMQPSEEIKEWLAEECEVSPETFDSIKIPDNMFIWASMNSADQGVFPMDTAMKRRWQFEYVGINDGEFLVDDDNYMLDENEEIKESQGGSFEFAGEKDAIKWNVLRRAINDKLMSDDIKAHEDKLMGPFFIKTTKYSKDENTGEISSEVIGKDEFIKLFCDKVLMYLFEDAAKTKRPQLFGGVKPDKINSYSYICEEFKKNGIGIFGEDFKKKYDKDVNNYGEVKKKIIEKAKEKGKAKVKVKEKVKEKAEE